MCRSSKVIQLPYFILASVLFYGCISPMNSSFESARMLRRGEIELTGGYSKYSSAKRDFPNTGSKNFGGRIGIGISDKFNLKAEYIRIAPINELDTALNYMHIAPKFSFIDDYFAVSPTIGFYFNQYNTPILSIELKLLGTYPASEKFDVTFAPKIIFLTPLDEPTAVPSYGLNLGFGLSTDLSVWAIRPEAGLVFSEAGGSPYWNIGIGLIYVLNHQMKINKKN
jgi:hypothetical protein